MSNKREKLYYLFKFDLLKDTVTMEVADEETRNKKKDWYPILLDTKENMSKSIYVMLKWFGLDDKKFDETYNNITKEIDVQIGQLTEEILKTDRRRNRPKL